MILNIFIYNKNKNIDNKYMSEEPIFINLITLGNSTVGKTCYLIRNTKNKFSSALPTVGKICK